MGRRAFAESPGPGSFHVFFSTARVLPSPFIVANRFLVQSTCTSSLDCVSNGRSRHGSGRHARPADSIPRLFRRGRAAKQKKSTIDSAPSHSTDFRHRVRVSRGTGRRLMKIISMTDSIRRKSNAKRVADVFHSAVRRVSCLERNEGKRVAMIGRPAARSDQPEVGLFSLV